MLWMGMVDVIDHGWTHFRPMKLMSRGWVSSCFSVPVSALLLNSEAPEGK